MRGSQKLRIWLAIPAVAFAGSRSAAKNEPISFASLIRWWMSIPLLLDGFSLFQQRFLLIGEITIVLLPRRELRYRSHFDGCDLVFGAARGPVRVFSRDHIGARIGMVKCRVHHARLNTF